VLAVLRRMLALSIRRITLTLMRPSVPGMG